MGNNLSVATYEAEISKFRNNLNNYNAKLAGLDADLTALNTNEKALKDLSDRMLAGVGAIYGKNSPEYEKTGGVREDKKKKPTRPTKPTV